MLSTRPGRTDPQSGPARRWGGPEVAPPAIRLGRIPQGERAVDSPPFIGYARRCSLAVVAVTALAATTRAQPPTTLSADPPPSVIDPESQPLPGAAAVNRVTAAACPCPTDAAPCPPALPPLGGPIHDRPKLTGDWFEVRTGLRDRGITIDVSTTQFYQGVTSGGLEQSFPYGGRNDYFLTFDGEKLGLWKGFYLKLHGETRYGESANFITGALSPVNEYLLVPGSQGTVSGLTGVEFTQALSENVLLAAGKINLLDHVYQPLTGATGLTGFMNVSLIFNPILARTLPYSAFGAGAFYLQDGEPVLALSVFDANDASTHSVFDRMFSNGAVVFGVGVLPTNLFGRPGHQGVEGTYSSGRYTNVQQSQYLDPVTGLVIPSTPKTGSWAVGYFFDQAVWVSPDDPKRVWGVFGKLGIADDNPNPIRWTAIAGVSGASPIRGRTRDTFGVGYFYLGISDKLKQSALPLTPLRNEQGVELYYNARVTPWFQLTPDLQVVVPFEKQVNTALLVGLRAKLDF
jgi:porin